MRTKFLSKKRGRKILFAIRTLVCEDNRKVNLCEIVWEVANWVIRLKLRAGGRML
jgi:transposase